jgi:hypothetical protein
MLRLYNNPAASYLISGQPFPQTFFEELRSQLGQKPDDNQSLVPLICPKMIINLTKMYDYDNLMNTSLS